MAYLQADLDALKRAYASGVREVEYAGRRTTFNSPADIRRVIAEIEAELAPASAAPVTTVGVYASGLNVGVDPNGWRRN